MLRLAFRVMADTRSADATPPLDGDPCAVDLEPPRRHGQPPARPPRSSPSASRGSSRPTSPCWLAEVDADDNFVTLRQTRYIEELAKRYLSEDPPKTCTPALSDGKYALVEVVKRELVTSTATPRAYAMGYKTSDFAGPKCPR